MKYLLSVIFENVLHESFILNYLFVNGNDLTSMSGSVEGKAKEIGQKKKKCKKQENRITVTAREIQINRGGGI